MNTIQQGLQQYLAVRSSLGYALKNERASLAKFLSFLEEQGASHITTDLAVGWAIQSRGAEPVTWAQRLGRVRRFAAWFNALDPRTEIPSQELLPHRCHRPRPYIYSRQEIERLMQVAAELPSPKGIRSRTYSTLIGLLAVTGMRLGEAVSLDRDDVDLFEGILTLRRTKFGKSRLIYLHRSTTNALKTYAQIRDRIFCHSRTPAFFVAERGNRISINMTDWTFVRVCRTVGLRSPAKGWGRGPRLHDLRHHFAVQTLIDWYRAGVDVERELPKLATYLGHAHVNDTYWYIEAVPELLQLVTDRLMRSGPGGRP
jgi:site-specific recombinase XerD